MVKKLLRNSFTVLLVILLLLTLSLAISSKLSGGAPKILGYEILEVLSGSMEPHIQTGSVIAVKPGIDKSLLKVGDIVTYKTTDNPNMLITHRVIEVQNKGTQRLFTTKGDANDAPDRQPIPDEQIVAKYINITIPYVGYFIHFEKTTAGIITLLIVPGTILVMWQVLSLFLAIFRMENKDKKTDEVHP
jgi:signal peptidase